MVSLTCSTERSNGVTLVTGRLTGTGTTQRVRLANELDGPVWPPRRRGVPEAGWGDGGLEAVVPADETVAVGYASPAPPADPPVTISGRTVCDADDRTETDASATPESAVRDLGDPSPPRDAVPVPLDDGLEDGDASATVDTERRAEADPHSTGVPPDVGSWFDAVETRVALAELLADAETLPEATEAVRAVGSLDQAAALVDDLDRDAAALASVAARAERLADRAGDSDVPLETFERIA